MKIPFSASVRLFLFTGNPPLDELHQNRNTVEWKSCVVESAARSLGTWERVSALLAEPAEAERQLSVAAAEGRIAVAADLVVRSAA